MNPTAVYILKEVAEYPPIPKLPRSNKKMMVKSSVNYNSKLIDDGYDFIIKAGDILSMTSKHDWRIVKR